MSARTPARKPARTRGSDAIAMLKADHRTVAGWFADYGKARTAARKQKLATRICEALRVHTTIEEEIFYPAFLKATGDKPMHHEAELEHRSAREVIAAIEESDPEDDYFDARVKVLGEMIRHHVKEEEQPGGMFAEARRSDMDLQSLGAEMRRRKDGLTVLKSARFAASFASRPMMLR